ncbi:MAG: GTPase [Pseudomonadota bacterium]
MPANLTQDYLNAEKKFRAARTPEEKLACLEEMLRVIPKHKGTDHMQADLRKRISKTKVEATKSKSTGKRTFSYYVEPEGIGQVFLVGPPNTGKSSLLDALTNASPLVAEFPFTTRTFQPGMMRYEDVWIQLVDLPPVSEQHMESWVPSTLRYGDVAVLCLSLATDDCLDQWETVLELLKKGKVVLAGRGDETGQFDTGIAALPTLLALTMAQAGGADERREFLEEIVEGRWPRVVTDVGDSASLDGFRKAVYDMLGKVRVYAKQRGKSPDLDEPFVLTKGDTVLDLARKIHKDIVDRLQFAKVWGAGKYDGQRVTRDYVLEERDVIELHF